LSREGRVAAVGISRGLFECKRLFDKGGVRADKVFEIMEKFQVRGGTGDGA
jgi:hypothetical protein